MASCANDPGRALPKTKTPGVAFGPAPSMVGVSATADRPRILLADDAFERLAAALDAPAAVDERLVELAQRSQRFDRDAPPS